MIHHHDIMIMNHEVVVNNNKKGRTHKSVNRSYSDSYQSFITTIPVYVNL